MYRHYFPPVTNRRAFSPERSPSIGSGSVRITNRRAFSPAEDAKAAKDLGRRPSSRWKGAPTRTHGRSDSFHDLREDRSGEDDGEDDPFFPFSNAKSGSDEKPSRPLGEFSLINTLNWDSDHYTTIQNALHEVSKRYFDTTLPLHEQNAYAKKCYIREALNLYPFLADYPSAWPAEEFAAMYLKNTSYVYRQKRRKRLSDIRRIKKPSQARKHKREEESRRAEALRAEIAEEKAVLEAAVFQATMQDNGQRDATGDLVFSPTSGSGNGVNDVDVEMDSPEPPEQPPLGNESQTKRVRKTLSRCEQTLRKKQTKFSDLLPTLRVVFDSEDPFNGASVPAISFASNEEVWTHRTSMEELAEHVANLDCSGDPTLVQCQNLLQDSIRSELQLIRNKVTAAWESNRAESLTAKVNPDSGVPKLIEPPISSNLASFSKPVLACLLTVVVLNLIPGLSREGCNWVLFMIRTIVASSCVLYVKSTTTTRNYPKPEDVLKLNSWPQDLRSAIEALDIDPKTVEFACCQKCFSLHPPGKMGRFPLRCNSQRFPTDPICNARLTRPNSPNRPIQSFLYQPLDGWLARLLSRPDMVQQIQSVQTSSWKSMPSKLVDIFCGSIWQTLQGPDARPFFEPEHPDGEMRLSFTLNIDWFNPHGRKTSGKIRSVGAIYLVCMNLPKFLRYRPENVYLAGIIPGPGEPDKDEINHFLRLIVNDLKRLWDTGVFVSRTSLHRLGCLVRCIVIALVADLPALRKIGGFVSYNSKKYPCSYCLITKNEFHRTDTEKFPRRTREQHLQAAERYRRASSQAERDAIAKADGVRWSELLNLPYMDVSEFPSLDSMHNLLLNNCKNHCRVLWGMDGDQLPPKSMQPHGTEQQEENLQSVAECVRNKDAEGMTSIRKSYIKAVAMANDIDVQISASAKKKEITKAQYIQALIKWRGNGTAPEIALPAALDRPVYHFPTPDSNAAMLDGTLLSEVIDDMDKTWVPSWIQKLPRGLGSKSTGKLSADQWRNLCSIFLVLTLARLWGNGTESQQRMLANFVSLVIAVTHATKRSLSEEDIKIADDNLRRYIKDAVALFGTDVLTINHHLSLHLPEFLRRLGPVHGWWAFPFERYNGIIQRYNTNSRNSELESTFMRTFCRSANVRALIVDGAKSDQDLDIMGLIRSAFDRCFGSELKGTLNTDILSFNSNGEVESIPTWNPDKPTVSLSKERFEELGRVIDASSEGAVYENLCQVVPSITVEGVEYCATSALPDDEEQGAKKGKKIRKGASSAAFGNCLIEYRVGEGVAVGTISDIIVHEHTPAMETKSVAAFYLCLYRVKEIPEEEQLTDPLRRFPDLHARIIDAGGYERAEIIRPTDVISHVAVSPYSESRYAILSLNRVSSDPSAATAPLMPRFQN